jgi:hypothetical protein
MKEDVFLLSLVTIAGVSRGRKFILKEEEALGVLDKWLCLLSGVSTEQIRNGLVTPGQKKKIEVAARILNKFPIFVEGSEDGPMARYLVDPDS